MNSSSQLIRGTTNRLGADLRLPSSRILSRPSLGALWSPIREHWQLFPNFEQLMSARCLTIFKVLTPPPPKGFSPKTHVPVTALFVQTLSQILCVL